MDQKAPIDAERIDTIAAMVRGMIEGLVDDPDSVLLSVVTQGNQSEFRVQVPASDLGKVIGKEGRTARALRTILRPPA